MLHDFVFLGEGTSDQPLAEIVRCELAARGVDATVHVPDFSRLSKVKKDIASRAKAALELYEKPTGFVVHRDCDNVDASDRSREIQEGVVNGAGTGFEIIEVIPRTMTETWILLSEQEIRRISGKPSGRRSLNLPSAKQVESVRDPKALLKAKILEASEFTGRKREALDRRFPQNRVRLLTQLVVTRELQSLPSWQQMESSIDQCVSRLMATS